MLNWGIATEMDMAPDMSSLYRHGCQSYADGVPLILACLAVQHPLHKTRLEGIQSNCKILTDYLGGGQKLSYWIGDGNRQLFWRRG